MRRIACRMFRTRTAAAVAPLVILASLLLGAAACTRTHHSGGTADLPPASQLLASAAVAMGTVQSVHFTIDAQGSLGGVNLHHAEGDLTRDGKAKGTATIDESGSTVEASFVVVGGTFYLKGATGGYQAYPLALASTIYDPTAILDPNRGVVKLLATSSNPRTESLDQVNGEAAYKIAITPDPVVLAALVPGAGSGASGDIWLGQDSHRLVKAVFTLPGSGGSSTAPTTVTIVFTNYDAPVSISAP